MEFTRVAYSGDLLSLHAQNSSNSFETEFSADIFVTTKFLSPNEMRVWNWRNKCKQEIIREKTLSSPLFKLTQNYRWEKMMKTFTFWTWEQFIHDRVMASVFLSQIIFIPERTLKKIVVGIEMKYFSYIKRASLSGHFLYNKGDFPKR